MNGEFEFHILKTWKSNFKLLETKKESHSIDLMHRQSVHPTPPAPTRRVESGVRYIKKKELQKRDPEWMV